MPSKFARMNNLAQIELELILSNQKLERLYFLVSTTDFKKKFMPTFPLTKLLILRNGYSRQKGTNNGFRAFGNLEKTPNEESEANKQ